MPIKLSNLLLCVTVVLCMVRGNISFKRLKQDYELYDIKTDGLLQVINSNIIPLDSSLHDKDNRNLRANSHSTVQKCFDTGEAYSASYLITKEHLLYQFTDCKFCNL